MRQTLFQISFSEPWTFWTPNPTTGWPEIGMIWVWMFVMAAYSAFDFWRLRGAAERPSLVKAVVWCLAGIPLGLLLKEVLHGKSLPVFGYGFLVMLGFLTAVITAQPRFQKVGLDPEMTWDAGMWLLIGGVVGGRLFYLVQYRDQVYQGVSSISDAVFATINLTAGGLVLIGALVGGGAGFVAFCRARKLSFPDVADAATPSMFLGIGFGRIGCLMNGCCFGDRCELPWGITFSNGSVPFRILKERGFVAANAPFTMPLHPTQIYSAIDGFLLAIVTAVLFAERRWKGEVFGWGCVIYSVTRFLIEFLRGDEMGQFGTGLTISQLYSIGIFALGTTMLVWGGRRAGTVASPAVST
ncbi:Prolipoprotein diacylglyceryl transferase [Caulifigura coniformis]|uniref:Phosphatidylglycerol--prolipoprotein diacylglyceryl transferase n=1 Tax=Caulifigura coniformis TaxID=2527983 RepID=A0A517SC04_9PLAN|nr:prolipoprotein diacylglyceryl transferase [Caulifigura coniformis]QDT53659.1 Prolipoprotein diacylglyceryl transferase [Caulifigura coniformis]